MVKFKPMKFKNNLALLTMDGVLIATVKTEVKMENAYYEKDSYRNHGVDKLTAAQMEV
jgi:hypothetical protein